MPETQRTPKNTEEKLCSICKKCPFREQHNNGLSCSSDYCDMFQRQLDKGFFWFDDNDIITILADPEYNALKRELKITIKHCPFCGANLENQK